MATIQTTHARLRYRRFAALAVAGALALGAIAGCGISVDTTAPPAIAQAHLDAPSVPVRQSEARNAELEDALANAQTQTDASADDVPPSWPPVASTVDLDSEASREWQRLARVDEAAFIERLAEGVSASELVAAVVARNPELDSALSIAEAVRAEHDQLDAVNRVLRQYDAFVTGLDIKVRPFMPGGLGPNAFPLPGPDGVRSALVEYAALIAEDHAEMKLRRLVHDARQAVNRELFLAEEERILDETLGLAESLKVVVRAQFEAGAAQLAEVLAVDAELAKLEDKRDDVIRSRAANRAQLARLVDVDDENAIALIVDDRPTGRIPPESPLTEPAVLAKNPDLRVVAHKASRTGLMIEMVELMARPDVDLDLSELPTPLGSRPDFRAGTARMPPGPWYGLMESYRAEMAHRLAALESAERATTNRLTASVRGAWQMYESAVAERILQETTLRDLVDRGLAVAMDAYRVGAITFDRTLDALRRRLDNSLAAAAAVRQLHDAHAMLELIVGPLAAK